MKRNVYIFLDRESQAEDELSEVIKQ